MDTRKRKLSQNLLGRRVRARAEPEPEPDLDDFEDGTNDSAPSEDGVAEEESGSEPASDSDASLRGSVSHHPTWTYVPQRLTSLL